MQPPRVSLGGERWVVGWTDLAAMARPGLICGAPVSGVTPEGESSREGLGEPGSVPPASGPALVSQRKELLSLGVTNTLGSLFAAVTEEPRGGEPSQPCSLHLNPLPGTPFPQMSR